MIASRRWWVAWAALAAWGGPRAEPPPADPTPGVLEHRFTFAVLADTHITAGTPDHVDRLARTVEWLNDEADARRIELVVLLGDIGWSGGLPLARDEMDELDLHWAPVSGDNLVHAGGAADFGEVFADQLAALEGAMDDWQAAEVPVHDPDAGVDRWLNNFAFTHAGVRFVTLDWASRSDDALEGEGADLYDFEGGSLPFLAAELDALPQGPDEDVVILSHNPMHRSPGAFTLAEMEFIQALTLPRANRVAGAYGGHYHVNADEPNDDGGYHVWVTDALYDDTRTVRLVQVWGDGATFQYRQELVDLGE